jgi:hypothetical protein
LPQAWQENSLTIVLATRPMPLKFAWQSPTLVKERQASFRHVVSINSLSRPTFRLKAIDRRKGIHGVPRQQQPAATEGTIGISAN